MKTYRFLTQHISAVFNHQLILFGILFFTAQCTKKIDIRIASIMFGIDMRYLFIDTGIHNNIES